MSKKAISILLSGLLITAMVFMAACTSAAPAVATTKEAEKAAPAAAATGKKYTIGLSSFQQGNDWNIQVAQGAKAKIKELGWDVVHTDANGDANAQISALEGFLSQKVDGVIIGGGSAPALQPAIDKLIAANIPVVCIDITVPNAVTNIYIDTYMTTELLGVFALNKMQAQTGKYVHLTIPGLGWKTVDIRDFIADKLFEIEKWTSYGVIDSGLADAVSKSMTGIRSALLAHPDINLVYSSWGMPAVGAARAIREAGLTDKVFVENTDADRIVLAEMVQKDSPIAAVIGQKPLLMGSMAVEYLQKKFNGETNIPKIAFAPFVFITKEPNLVPPGPEVMDPEKAWAVLYPGIAFGKTD